MRALRSILSTFPARAALLFVLLATPWPGLARVYGEWAAYMTNHLVGSNDPPVTLECRAAESSSEPPWDLHVRVGEPATGRVLEAALDVRRSGYLPSAVFLALAAVSPLRKRKRIALVVLGLVGLELLSLLPIVSFFSGKFPIVAFQMGAPIRWTLEVIYRSLLTPPGMAYAVPVLLWLLLIWALEPSVLYEG